MTRSAMTGVRRLQPVLALPLFCLLGLACADGGKKVSEPAPGAKPEIARLIPGRTVQADTVRVEGTGFGEAASGAITFSGGSGRITANALTWTDTAIEVLVPPGAVTGSISVRAGEQEGTEKTFSVAPVLISYADDLLPLFTSKGCVDCHSGDFATNNLHLDSATNIMRGDSAHGPVVLRRDGPGSIIVRKVSPEPPFGSRMPLGCTGACLTDAEILSLSDWIDQGTRNN